MNTFDQFIDTAKRTSKYREVYEAELKAANTKGYYGVEARSLANVTANQALFWESEIIWHNEDVSESDLIEAFWQAFESAYVDWYEGE